MTPSSPNPQPPKRQDQDERAKYKDGPFDHIEVPALASFVLCLLGLFLFLTWVRSLDGRHFTTGNEEGTVDRVARILMPPKMAFIPTAAEIPKPISPKAPTRPQPAPVDPTARGRIERSRKAVVERIEEVQKSVRKSGLMAILSAKGNGASGNAVAGIGSRLKLSGLSSLGSKLNGLEGLTRFGSNGGMRSDQSSEPEYAKIDKQLKGFDNAKRGALAKIGSAELDKPTRLDKGRRYANARNVQELHAVINRRQTSIRLLYEERLRTRPNLEGKVTLMLVIEEDGSVSDVSVVGDETTLDDPDLVQNIVRTVRRWVFPAFTGGAVELKTPFILKPQ
jgi:hypothetical protein